MNETAGKTPLILVVDDDWMNREVMEAHLMGANYDVIVAHNGAKALELAQATPPDLILLDVRMQGMNGYDVCRQLKIDDATKFSPVVMVTALESEEDKLEAINAGADDFISKPFTALMMLTRVKNLLRIKRLHDEVEDRNRLLRRILSRYVNNHLTETILAEPEKHLKLGGETRYVTVMFSDIRGFTAFAEQHAARDVLSLLNHFFKQMTEVIFRHNGTFDKYVGDEIVAFFGAPVATGHDTLNAVRAALELRSVFVDIRDSLPREDVQQLGLGIGLYSGEAAVGNVGSERVMSYTVIGDTVNTAHRLQGIAQDGEILVGETTYAQVADQVEAAQHDPVIIRGKRDPLTLYTITGLSENNV